MSVTDFILPACFLLICAYGLFKRVDLFSVFLEGAKENIKVAFDILPSLILLIALISMLKSSGALEFITELLSPLANLLGIKKECLPLGIMRPFSGSGALAIFDSVIKDFGPDSQIGRTASIMMGSTETTFYTITVYFSAAKIKPDGKIIAACLLADAASIIISSIAVKIFF